MQQIYLAVAGAALLAIIVPIIMRIARTHGLSDPRSQVAVAAVAGLTGAVLITSLRSDLVPDHLETLLAVAVVGLGSLAIGWYAWNAVRGR